MKLTNPRKHRWNDQNGINNASDVKQTPMGTTYVAKGCSRVILTEQGA